VNHYIVKNPVMSQAATGRVERAGKLIVFDTPIRTADGGLHGFLSARSSAHFKKEIDKANADAVLLIDLHATERPEFENALSRSKRARAEIVETMHADALRLREGFIRVALLPVGTSAPKGQDNRAMLCYAIPEIVRVFCETRHNEYVIDGRYKAKQRKVAEAGGLYTFAQIEDAYRQFKRDNPESSAWRATTALIMPGQALKDYTNSVSLWQRLERRSKKAVEKWYREL
jgi:hypothetical protein